MIPRKATIALLFLLASLSGLSPEAAATTEDGPLAYLPFDILRPNSASADFGSSFAVSLSPSISVSALRPREASPRGASPKGAKALALGGGWYDPDRRRAVARGASERGYTRADAADRADYDSSDEERGLSVEQLASVRQETKDESPGEYFAQRGFRWSDIPGTRREVEDIGALAFGGSLRILTGRDASEASLKRLSSSGELRSYDMVHLACHGYFDSMVPEMSSVVLSEVSGLLPDDREDGYLTVPEVVSLELDSRMVCLSACSTGLARVKRGDGMVGLVRSFLVAGSRNVGVSLWNVDDDATREFMTRVYQKVIKGGLDFSHAYAAVKDEFRRDPAWSHPYYWAAFTTYQ